ncbi:MAG: O-antigen ligase family protein [Microscillaceae bacterium]|nr:O-antigen ligase family protein [Microscillaceae bacterium]
MKLSLRFLYLLPLFLVLSTDATYDGLGFRLEKPIIVLLMLASFYFYREYKSWFRVWFCVYVLYFLALCLEGYYLYNRPLGHLHVSAKMMVCFSIFSLYGFYKRFGEKVSIKGIIFIIMTGFILNALLVNSRAFSLGAFLNHERGISSDSVYLLIIPLLYNFNTYLKEAHWTNLFSFLLVAFLIFFLQHRTVWVSSVVCLFVNFLLIRRAHLSVSLRNVLPFAMVMLILGLVASTYVLSDEKISQKISHSFAQILNPTGNDKDDEESTSEWRYQQNLAYWPFIEENPVFGMRFYGFDLPIQFYSIKDGEPVFEDGTGHHFHSLYVDRLFYQGLFGLLLLLLPMVYFLGKALIYSPRLSIEQLVLLAYFSSALIFGISYNWPTYIYGLLGYVLFRVEVANIPRPQPEKQALVLAQA